MKLTGLLAEKGLQALSVHDHSTSWLPRLWIVIVDQKKASIYSKVSSQKLVLIAQAYDQEILHLHHNKKLSDAQDAEERHDEQGFAQALGQWLSEAEKEKTFDRLAIIAAPRALGYLRKSLDKRVHDRVIAELDKDLAGLPDHEIRMYLEKLIWF